MGSPAARRSPFAYRSVLGAVLISFCTSFALSQVAGRWRAQWRLDGATDSAGMAAAAALDAGNDQGWARWARQLELEGRAGLPGWLRAAGVNPRRGEWLVEAALELESAGDQERAEQLLLRAERFNRTWVVRWTLAGYYLRQGRQDLALQWAQAASARAYGDRTALFALCRQAGADDRRILTQVVGNDPPNLAAFVRDVARHGSSEVIVEAAERFLAVRQHWKHLGGNRDEARDTIEMALDALLAQNRGESAVRLARQLANESWSGSQTAGRWGAPANPDFRLPWTGHGFSWRHVPEEGVDVRPATQGDGVRISFSGGQAPGLELLAQPIYLERGGEWELGLEYRAHALTPRRSGVGWHLLPWSGNPAPVRLDRDEPVWSAETWSHGAVSWRVPAGGGLYRLVLAAVRPSGQTRVEGELGFRRVGLRWLRESGQ